MPKSPVKVLVSGAAGNIAYSILPIIVGPRPAPPRAQGSGLVFGPEQPVDLVLLDIPPALPKLKGVVMELEDSNFPCLHSYVASSDPMEAFAGVQYAILLGGFPRGPGMERKDLISRNTSIFKAQGQAIEAVADKSIHVLVVANPANTNCWVLMKHAPSIPRTHFASMTRLDYNRCRGRISAMLSEELGHSVSPLEVKNCIIWGNHSSTQVPDVRHATYQGKPVRSLLADKTAYLDGEFIPFIQQRGKAVIDARGLSSAFSAAEAAALCMRDWVQGTPAGETVAMGVCSDGNKFGVAEDLVFSFPCRCVDGEWVAEEALGVDGAIRALVDKTQKELQDEKEEALGFCK